MARKTSVPSQQLDRLRDLYNRQRGALVTLADAQQGLKDAQASMDSAYQALVMLIGAAAAAQLTGRRVNGKRTTAASPKPNDELREQQASRADSEPSSYAAGSS